MLQRSTPFLTYFSSKFVEHLLQAVLLLWCSVNMILLLLNVACLLLLTNKLIHRLIVQLADLSRFWWGGPTTEGRSQASTKSTCLNPATLLGLGLYDKLYSPYNGSIIKIVLKNLTNLTIY